MFKNSRISPAETKHDAVRVLTIGADVLGVGMTKFGKPGDSPEYYIMAAERPVQKLSSS
jgi:hypothetical protein